jgi:hypothetical protein
MTHSSVQSGSKGGLLEPLTVIGGGLSPLPPNLFVKFLTAERIFAPERGDLFGSEGVVRPEPVRVPFGVDVPERTDVWVGERERVSSEEELGSSVSAVPVVVPIDTSVILSLKKEPRRTRRSS